MNKAIEILDHEHQKIKQVIDHVRTLIRSIIDGEKDINTLSEWLEFFRTYADQYHHGKEEKILFPKMIHQNSMLEFGVIQEMLENHEDFREQLSEIQSCIERNDPEGTRHAFDNYSEALLEHIAVEDEEVFQIAETLLSEDELLTISNLFEDSDRELGFDEKYQWEARI